MTERQHSGGSRRVFGPDRDPRLLVGAGVAVLALVVGSGVVVATRGGDSTADPATRVTVGSTVSPSPPSDQPGGTPAAPYSGPTLFGVSIPVGARPTLESATGVVQRITERFGTIPVARVYGDTAPTGNWMDDPTLASLPADTSVVYSFKANPDDVTSGVHDDQLRAFLASRPKGIDVWVAYYHEPEDDIRNGSFTAQQFRDATAHVAPIVRAEGAYPIEVLQQYTLNPASGRAWKDYYSPSVDVIAWDAYNTAAKARPPSYLAADSLVEPVMEVAKETGKRFAWAEYGSQCISTDPDCTQRAAWLDQVGTAFRTNGAEFALYWNRRALKGDTDYTLDDTPSVDTFRAFLAR